MLAGLFAFTSLAVAKPQPGDLDPSFSGNGVALTLPDGRNGVANDVAIGRQHRIVVAGSNSIGFALARYEPNGKLDDSFSGDGMRSTAFGDEEAAANAVAIGRKGLVVAAGTTCPDSGACRFAVAEYGSDGGLDRSFGNGGRVTLGFGSDGRGSDAFASSVMIDSHHRILVAGTACRERHCDFALARLRQDGTRDRKFGGDGRVITHFSLAHPTAHAGISSLAIDSRGRILAGGVARDERAVLVRYKPRGLLSRSFGDHGIAMKELDHLGGIDGIALTPRDKIVAVGHDKRNFSTRWAVARFGRSGGLDKSFGDGGQVTTGLPGKRGVSPHAVAIDSRNRIVVAGAPGFSLARYQPNGNLNRSFGHHGKVSESFGFGFATSVAIDTHSRPVVTGWAKRRFATARFFG